jgi:hypothetical protein
MVEIALGKEVATTRKMQQVVSLILLLLGWASFMSRRGVPGVLGGKSMRKDD